MARRLLVLFAAVAVVPFAVRAQAPAAESSKPISASHSKMYTMLSGVVVAAAEKMPEENYSLKPSPDVRSFGQIVGHLADSQCYFCALASGETKPDVAVEKTKTGKADLVSALKDAVAGISALWQPISVRTP